MRHRSATTPPVLTAAAVALSCATTLVALTQGCANNKSITPVTTTSTGTGGTGGKMAGSTSATGGTGGMIINFPEAGPDAEPDGDAEAGPSLDCNSQCGPMEKCDQAHLGYDDNCNGEVDEGCSCNPGQTHWCFKGDPKWRNTPGCYDGTETCTELGTWGPCNGGVHAIAPDNCFQNNTAGCHAISATPFSMVDLKQGTGTFSVNAVAGSESYNVQCPMGVSPCPAVMPPESFQPLQSGQYNVTYTKNVAGDPNPETCTFPLIVGAPGLRVELSWEHHVSDSGVDLDLHMHQPVNTDPWATFPAAPQDCGYKNCRYQFFAPPGTTVAPSWFPLANVAPAACNWDLQTNASDNTCYNDPRGVGAEWQTLGMGCHNPRLDVDNVQCDFSVTDPSNAMFCTPENINVDFPPKGQWFRLAVHYFRNYGMTYDVHPEIKVFVNGSQFADLGPQGFYNPPSPVTFQPADGAGMGMGNRFWLVADVAVVDDGCGNATAVVQPLYSDPTNSTPLFTIDTAATSAFAPPWPPAPQ